MKLSVEEEMRRQCRDNKNLEAILLMQLERHQAEIKRLQEETLMQQEEMAKDTQQVAE